MLPALLHCHEPGTATLWQAPLHAIAAEFTVEQS